MKGVWVLIEAEDIDRGEKGVGYFLPSRPGGCFAQKVPDPFFAPAYSLIEAIMIVLFLGIFAFIALPRLDYGIVKRYKAEATAKKIVTDLRLARSLAISEAATNTKGFDLNMLGGGPYTGYEIENADTKAIVTTCTLDSDVSVTGDVMFKFEPLGNTQTGDGQLTVSAEGKSFTITVFGVTGMTRCVEN